VRQETSGAKDCVLKTSFCKDHPEPELLREALGHLMVAIIWLKDPVLPYNLVPFEEFIERASKVFKDVV
jgi:hypothetical protein